MILAGDYIDRLEQLVAEFPTAAVEDPNGCRLDLTAAEALAMARENMTSRDQMLDCGMPYVRDATPDDLPRFVGGGEAGRRAMRAVTERLRPRPRSILMPSKILVSG